MRRILLAVLSAALTCCAAQAQKTEGPKPPATDLSAHPAPSARAPFSSTYEIPASPATLIRGATVLTGSGTRLDQTDVLIENGHIKAVGPNLPAPAGALVIDATGRWVTPGIIDIHSHLGVYASPAVNAQEDGNEMTNPVTANVWAEHSIWPQDPGFETALEGGVTTLEILPGSGNLIGGRSVVVKNVHATTYQAMKFPGAPYGLKMACGENPKRVYGSKGQFPSTLMGDVAGYRQAFADAQDYRNQWDKYYRELAEYEKKKNATQDGNASKDKSGEKKEPTQPVPPKRDLKLETLVGVLKGDIRVQMHCYRSDQMATMLDVADEFGFKIAAFHHASEAYKIADLWRNAAYAPRCGRTGGASRWNPTTASRKTSPSSMRRSTAARCCIQTPRTEFSASIRKPLKPWRGACAQGCRYRPSVPSAGLPSIRRKRLGSRIASAPLNLARTRTSSFGAAIPSVCMRWRIKY
jgi:imidazolonepropionase-like amidohydrolase